MHRQTLLSLSTYPSFSKSGCLFYFSSHAFKIIHLQSLGFRKIYSTMLVFNKYDLRIIFCTHFNKRKIFHYHTFSHHFSSRPLNNPHTLILSLFLKITLQCKYGDLCLYILYFNTRIYQNFQLIQKYRICKHKILDWKYRILHNILLTLITDITNVSLQWIIKCHDLKFVQHVEQNNVI